MRNRLDEPMSLESMARIACSSPYHFNRTFRQVTGVPPAQFLYALRLDTARRLLMQTKKKVIDICYEVGYNSVGTFTRRFTDLLGISPTALREMAQAKTEPIADCSSLSSEGQQAQSEPGVSGYVKVPAGFKGIIFIGLFESPIPQAKPVACAVTNGSGFYRIQQAPEGEFYLFALGLTYPLHAQECLHYETALRGGGQSLRISAESVSGPTYLRLRPASPLDPPILLALPALTDEFLKQKQVDQSAECTTPKQFETDRVNNHETVPLV
jgi:AraC-like DNA-binding protein